MNCSPTPQHTPPANTTAAPKSDAQTTAAAEDCGYGGCHGPFYPAGDLEFGDHLMGFHYPSVPSSYRAQGECDFRWDPGCEYRGADGVLYLLEHDDLVRKRIDVSAPPRDGLPFGLTGHETPAQALAILRTHTPVPMHISTQPGAGAILVGNEGTLRNALNSPLWLYLVFTPRGVLEEIRLQGPPTETD
jgi:hypothetical protein